MTDLVELDSLEILVIVDNELDPLSPCANEAVTQTGGLIEVSMRKPLPASDPRAGSAFEFRMDNICCGAHGLSLLVTGVKDGQRRTMLFDTGPEESAWERNAKRLKADIAKIELIHLSHWHRDHSGGMLRVLDMIEKARRDGQHQLPPVNVDLHPDRPAFRGVNHPRFPIVALEADPTFDEVEKHGGVVHKHDEDHTVLDGMFLISGKIPRVTEYEKGLEYAVRFNPEKKAWESDEEIADERLVMCKLKGKGIVVLTGCSHAGVVNASKCAAGLGKEAPLYAVMGGFHLATAQPALVQRTVEDLKAMEPRALITGHCTGWRAKFEIQKQMPGSFTPCFVGSQFVL